MSIAGCFLNEGEKNGKRRGLAPGINTIPNVSQKGKAIFRLVAVTIKKGKGRRERKRKGHLGDKSDLAIK